MLPAGARVSRVGLDTDGTIVPSQGTHNNPVERVLRGVAIARIFYLLEMMPVGNGRRPSTASSKCANSTVLSPSRTSVTCSKSSRPGPTSGSTNSCRGTGKKQHYPDRRQPARVGWLNVYTDLLTRHERIHQISRAAKLHFDAGDADGAMEQGKLLNMENGLLLNELLLLAMAGKRRDNTWR